MVRQLETYSNVEVHETLRFLWTKHFMSTEIHREISTIYGTTRNVTSSHREIVPAGLKMVAHI